MKLFHGCDLPHAFRLLKFARARRRRRQTWSYVSSVDTGARTLQAFTVSLLLALVIELWNGESSTSNSSDNNQNDVVREVKRSSRQTELSSRIRASPSCFFIWRLDFTLVASSSYLPIRKLRGESPIFVHHHQQNRLTPDGCPGRFCHWLIALSKR